MSSPYDDNFRKIAALADLAPGKPRVFRSGGTTIVLRREGDEVSAIDGSCIADVAGLSADDRLRRILDCVASGTGSGSKEWDELRDRARLRVRVDGEAIWVCLDGCDSA